MGATDVGDTKKKETPQILSPTSKHIIDIIAVLNSFVHEDHPNFILDVTLKPRPDRNQNFEDLIRKCDILEGESEDL